MYPKNQLANTLVVSLAHAVVGGLVHYPPNITNINSIEFVLNGTGAPGIYNSSATPDDIYGEYNWCNMPHVRMKEYTAPSNEFTLEYVEVIHRHHKRTPYASNTFFAEDIPWSCDEAGPVYYGTAKTPKGARDVSVIQWQAAYNDANPFTTSIGPGFANSTCQFPQESAGGVDDSHTHGADLRSVYAPLLGLSSSIDYETVAIRVTNNVITSQVAGGVVAGLFPDTVGTPVQVLIQSDSFDSLEPAYSCPNSVTIMTDYKTDNTSWTGHLTAAAGLYEKLDAVSGIETNDTADWHTSFDHYYDNMSAKQCHDKTLPCSVNDTSLCVTQDEADTVYRLGNWEYSYYYRDAQNSTLYSALHYGAWILELKGHLEAKIAGGQMKYFHNVAHDESMSCLLGFFQISKMVWPGMGSEIVFELYKKNSIHDHYASTDGWYLRVLWGGEPMQTSTPLGTLDMIPVDSVLDYIESYIGTSSDLYAACTS
ncbi:phosphoglycerate mutase-like protein [Stereum hirsutum FP-91666 SS1]|uniref:phosphoglycerate mutase-like protein n=1 Tax=Stereum hirsutum (strain FP-91666) TaxID=721885 RepID=UPI000444A509|nr:phosphoglycerate mutase-like protein [Stereum hirsutum FP-91666 SS1]EIM82919.1 phosphoglycerate mutase-like protein [Stereum hirsutum FP-91666 SS1]